jgi:hypothetical protein
MIRPYAQERAARHTPADVTDRPTSSANETPGGHLSAPPTRPHTQQRAARHTPADVTDRWACGLVERPGRETVLNRFADGAAGAGEGRPRWRPDPDAIPSP